MSNQQDACMEAEIKELGLNAPRVTKEQIDNLMSKIIYKTHVVEGTTTTLAVAILPMGDTDFTLAIGQTACIDKANFNAELGVKYAIQNAENLARNKLWELEGYILARDLMIIYSDCLPQDILVPSVEDVAEACHNINRAYCQAIGDDSQPTWADAPEWQKSSAINGVKFHLENPNASPSASHDSWLAQKVAEGWVYGEVKDAEKKTHPCCVTYDDLPKEQKAKDYLFKQTVHSFVPFIFQEEPLSPHNTINS